MNQKKRAMDHPSLSIEAKIMSPKASNKKIKIQDQQEFEAKTEKKKPKFVEDSFAQEKTGCHKGYQNEKKSLIPYYFSGIKTNRGVMLDWLLDVCASLAISWEIYWCAVEILDFLIIHSQIVNLQDIHIIGGCCIFLANKARSCTFDKRISLIDLYEKVFHGKFKVDKILQYEGKILVQIGKNGEKSKHFSTIYDATIHKLHKKDEKLVREFFRQLVLIWIYPAHFFAESVSYSQIQKLVMKEVSKESEVPGVNLIEEIFVKLKCTNLIKECDRMKRIPL